MHVHTLDKAGLINELQIGTGISQAVLHGRRADFSLMLALFSNDVRDTTPVEAIEQVETTEDVLRQRFELQAPKRCAVTKVLTRFQPDKLTCFTKVAWRAPNCHTTLPLKFWLISLKIRKICRKRFT